MPRPKERTPELREKLLDVAVDLLAEEGVSGVTTRRVAARAGASAPAIYELFTDKAGLVRALFFEGFRRLGTVLDALPTPTGDPEDVSQLIRVFRGFTLANPQLFAVMYGKPFADFEPTPREQHLGDVTRQSLIGRVRSCVERGTLVGDPSDIAHAVLALAIGLATQESGGWLGSSSADRERRWSEASAGLLRGFAPRGPRT